MGMEAGDRRRNIDREFLPAFETQTQTQRLFLDVGPCCRLIMRIIWRQAEVSLEHGRSSETDGRKTECFHSTCSRSWTVAASIVGGHVPLALRVLRLCGKLVLFRFQRFK